MGATKTRTVLIEDFDCSECGVTIWLEAEFVRRRREDKRAFYCPNGHNQYFPGKTKAQKLAAELDMANTRLANQRAETDAMRQQRDDAKNRERAQKAAKTRIKNRVSKGVCPCCNRTSVNLQRHMESKHPSYQKSD